MRIIGHLDLDAFFASVEERDHEWFRGRPLIVGADPQEGRGRGVVSTANYKARKYGIHSAMPISTAWRFCEEAKLQGLDPCVFAAPDFKNYSATSERIMAIVRKYSPLVEQASVDEACFQLNSKLQNPNYKQAWKNAEKTANKLKKEIFEKEKLTCSIGIGPNKLIAKIASDFKKPDGLTIVTDEQAEAFLEPLAVRKIPGIGLKTEAELLKLKVKTVKDLKKFSQAELQKIFGKWGIDFYDKIRGRGDSEIIEEREVKSIGAEVTFEKDKLDSGVIFNCLAELVSDVFERFRSEGFKKFKTVAIKIRFTDFETKTSAHTLAQPTDSAEKLRFEAMKLLVPYLDRRKNPWQKPVRLIGVRLEKLQGE